MFLKLTGVSRHAFLLYDDVCHHVELTFRVLGGRGMYSIRRVREVKLPFTKCKEQVHEFTAKLVEVPFPSPEDDRHASSANP